MNITIRTGKKISTHEVETKPLTLICHTEPVQVMSVANTVEVTPVTTLLRTTTLTQHEFDMLTYSAQFLSFYGMVFKTPFPESLEDLKAADLGVRHVTGMLVLIAEIYGRGEQPFIRLPETYLHPANQSGLGDVFVRLSCGPKD